MNILSLFRKKKIIFNPKIYLLIQGMGSKNA